MSDMSDESFFSRMAENLFNNYIVPRTTNLLHDFVAGSINMLGDTAQAGIDNAFKEIGWNGTTKLNSSNTGVRYNNMYQVGSSVSKSSNVVTPKVVASTSPTMVKTLILPDENACKQLFAHLQEVCTAYGRVTIQDVYNSFEPAIPCGNNPMVSKNGWTSLELGQFQYQKIFTDEYGVENRGKYLITHPQPKSIENI